MVVGAGSFRLATDVDRGIDTALIPDIPLSSLATIGAITAETIPTTYGTNIKESGAQFEGPHDDPI